MKPEEALKELSYDDTTYGGKCTYEVRIEAIKALEKQIPKKITNMKRILDFFWKLLYFKMKLSLLQRKT